MDMQKYFGFEASSVTSNACVSFHNRLRGGLDRGEVVIFLHGACNGGRLPPF